MNILQQFILFQDIFWRFNRTRIVKWQDWKPDFLTWYIEVWTRWTLIIILVLSNPWFKDYNFKGWNEKILILDIRIITRIDYNLYQNPWFRYWCLTLTLQASRREDWSQLRLVSRDSDLKISMKQVCNSITSIRWI